ncbi:MAG TPA: sialate O-acetylesterase [Chitinispirillaceae bacterium]|nr:sialate O-acetylesterase [Chitinispirillaceae bacterium]
MNISRLFSVPATLTTLVVSSLFAPNGYSQQDPNFYIFLAFGQSNMDGAGNIETEDRTVDARFRVMYAADNDGSRTKGKWATAVPPLCRGNSKLCPADYFGRTLVDSLPSNIKIGIINVAIPGTKIEVFVKDSYQSYLSGLSSNDQYIKNYANNSYGGNCYGRLVEMGKLAQNDGVIKGFLLHQGESNPNDRQWPNKVKSIYDGFISEFGLKASETPLLAGELLYTNRGGACGGFNIFIDTLNRVIPNAHAISADGLAGVDKYHFTSASYRTFGKRYADTMLSILKKQKTNVGDGKNTKSSLVMKNSADVKVFASSITFQIPEKADVTLKAYTLEGKELTTITHSEFNAGVHALAFRRDVISAGVFVLRLDAGKFSATRTVVAASR